VEWGNGQKLEKTKGDTRGITGATLGQLGSKKGGGGDAEGGTNILVEPRARAG